MKKDLDKKNEIAISVKNVSKTFRIPCLPAGRRMKKLTKIGYNV